MEAGALILFSLLMAFGQWLPALLLFCQGLGTSSPTCYFHLFTHLAPESSNPGPFTSSAPFLTHFCRLTGREPTACCSLSSLLSRGLGGTQHIPQASLVPSVSMVLVSRISPEEHPSHPSPAFPGLVPTLSKPATVLYASKRVSLL